MLGPFDRSAAEAEGEDPEPEAGLALAARASSAAARRLSLIAENGLNILEACSQLCICLYTRRGKVKVYLALTCP